MKMKKLLIISTVLLSIALIQGIVHDAQAWVIFLKTEINMKIIAKAYKVQGLEEVNIFDCNPYKDAVFIDKILVKMTIPVDDDLEQDEKGFDIIPEKVYEKVYEHLKTEARKIGANFLVINSKRPSIYKSGIDIGINKGYNPR